MSIPLCSASVGREPLGNRGDVKMVGSYANSEVFEFMRLYHERHAVSLQKHSAYGHARTLIAIAKWMVLNNIAYVHGSLFVRLSVLFDAVQYCLRCLDDRLETILIAYPMETAEIFDQHVVEA